MKRLFLLMICLVMFASCTPTTPEVEYADVLLTLDGQTLITGEDMQLAIKEAEIISEIYGGEYDAENIFEVYGETRILAYLADAYKVDVDEDFYAATWQAMLSELKSDETRAEELGALLATMDALGMDEEQYSAYVVEEYIINAKVEEFIAHVASDFALITDPHIMTQTVKENIMEMVRVEGLECFYPGKEDYFPSFVITVGE